MASRFTIIGKLEVAKNNDRHKGFEDKLTDKGGVVRTLRLGCKSNENFFNLQIKGFLNSAVKNDDKLNVDESIIYSLTKKDDKYESVKFKYKDKDKYMNDIAEFKKFVFVNDNKRFEFCNQFDYSELVYSELTSGKFDGAKFRIVGEIEYTEYTNPKTHETKVYTNYNVDRIYVVSDDTEETATANMEIYITEECIDDSRLDEENLFILNGYIPQYDNKKKGDIGFYKQFEYPLNAEGEKAKLKYDLIKKILIDNFDDNELCKIGFKVELINKREEVPFDEDKLSDDEKQLVKFGLMTIEDLKEQYGAGMGKMQEKLSVMTISKGYSLGAKPTELTIAELMKKADEQPKPKTEVNIDLNEGSTSGAEDLDIFGDDEDDLPF